MVTTAHPTQQVHIIEAFLQRLRKQIPEFSDEAACFHSDLPFPLESAVPPADVFCTVAVDDGVFPDAFYTGGGAETINENGGLTITVFSKHLDDQPGHLKSTLAKTHGLVARYKLEVLRAMLKDTWMPQDDDGYLLRDFPSPVRSVGPKLWTPSKGGDWAFISISVATNFDWKL